MFALSAVVPNGESGLGKLKQHTKHEQRALVNDLITCKNRGKYPEQASRGCRKFRTTHFGRAHVYASSNGSESSMCNGELSKGC